MPLKVISYGESAQYEFQGFDHQDSRIILYQKDSPESLIEIKYPLKIDNSFEGKQFYFYYLAKQNIRENDIFQVFDKSRNKRIGWCIPINALDSLEHDYVDDKHFLKYAYIGAKEALLNISEKIWTNEVDVSNSSELKFSNLFHESTALLIISKETLDGDQVFSISGAIPSLIKAGYVQLTNNSPSLLTLDRPSPNRNKINIEFISNCVDGKDLIASLLINFAFSQDVLVLRFFYLYQIIELLMECVFENEQKQIVGELLNCHSNSAQTKEVLERIQNYSSEKKKLNLLINKYCNLPGELEELKTSCNAMQCYLR